MYSYYPPPAPPGQDDFTRFILGIVKLAAFMFIMMILTSIGAMDFNIDPSTGFDVSTIIKLIVAIAPLLLLVSALRDLGVR